MYVKYWTKEQTCYLQFRRLKQDAGFSMPTRKYHVNADANCDGNFKQQLLKNTKKYIIAVAN